MKTCFVIMGFGEKTDHTTGRTLNLNKSYAMIKRAVMDAGVECVRADEIPHSGAIDLPMYERLLNADLVIADLSTYNPNALYELGVRHALRPHTTIIVAESEFKPPFDISHTVFRSYEHLGKGIDFEEVERFQTELTGTIKTIIGAHATDSPVYTFLPNLEPPSRAGTRSASAPSDETTTAPAIDALLQQAEGHLSHDPTRPEDFQRARDLFKLMAKLKRNDDFIIQQLAFTTYKAKDPDETSALEAARDILWQLDPTRSTDPETLGLWGAVQKRLWEIDQHFEDLDRAINACEKGFFLRNDHYNGINLAYLLNLRADLDDRQPEERVADYVQAKRIRARVLEISREELNDLVERASRRGPSTEEDQELYWLHAAQAEALVGMELENTEVVRELLEKLPTQAPQPWMWQSTVEQLGKLKSLVAKSPLKLLNI